LQLNWQCQAELLGKRQEVGKDSANVVGQTIENPHKITKSPK
jgi:hypothetical protein